MNAYLFLITQWGFYKLDNQINLDFSIFIIQLLFKLKLKSYSKHSLSIKFALIKYTFSYFYSTKKGLNINKINFFKKLTAYIKKIILFIHILNNSLYTSFTVS